MKTIVIICLLALIVLVGWRLPDEPHTYGQALRMLFMGVLGAGVLYCIFFWNGKRVPYSEDNRGQINRDYE